MKISTRSIYALEALLYLAIQPKGSSTSLKTIAQNRRLSLKYLEQIFSMLKDAGILLSIRGKNGGYQFAKSPSTITAYDILQILELEWTIGKANEDVQDNIAHTVYTKLKEEMTSVLSYYTLEDLAVAYQQTMHDDFMI